MRISFLIPTKDGGEGFDKLIKSIRSNINYAYRRGYSFEYATTLIINGNPNKPLSYVEKSSDVRGFVKIKRVGLLGKMGSINFFLREDTSDIIVIFDDDIYFSEELLHLALQDLDSDKNLRLVAFQARALPYTGWNPWSHLLYDVINIRSLRKLYKGIDPFLFGRFLVIKKDALKVPDNIINEDLYLSLIHDGHYLIRPEEVFYTGEHSIISHVKRVLRIEAGRDQAMAMFGSAYTKIINKNKREIDKVKLKKAGLYYEFCYYCYVVLRFFTNRVIAKIFRHQTVHW